MESMTGSRNFGTKNNHLEIYFDEWHEKCWRSQADFYYKKLYSYIKAKNFDLSERIPIKWKLTFTINLIKEKLNRLLVCENRVFCIWFAEQLKK